MNNWSYVKLANVTTKVGSGATPRGGKASYMESGIPLIRSMNVHFDGFKSDGLAYLDESQAQALDAVEVRAHDVLLNITGASIGRVTVTPARLDGARVNQHVCIIRPKPDLDPSFLRWYLASPGQQQLIMDVQSGATRQALTKDKILNLEVPLPPLAAQHQIVAEIEEQFSRLDEAVANLKRVKANLARYRLSVINAACRGALTNGSVGGELWPTVALSDLIRSGDYGTSVRCSYDNQGVAVLRIPNIAQGHIELQDVKRAPIEYQARDTDLLAPGDLLIIRTNGSKNLIGRGAVVLEKFGVPVTFASYLIRFRLTGNPDLWKWVALALDSADTRRWIEGRAASSAGQHNVSLSLLKTMPIRLAGEGVRRVLIAEVERSLSMADEMETQADASLRRAERLRQAILKRAFEGNLG